MYRLWGIGLLVLLVALAGLSGAAAQGGDELLVNGDFAEGGAGWAVQYRQHLRQLLD